MRGSILVCFGCVTVAAWGCGSEDAGDGSGQGGSAGSDAAAGTGGSALEAGPDATTQPSTDVCENDDGTQPSGPVFFVRAGSNGDGSSWSNSWADVTDIDWSSITPGSRICIAGGAYGNLAIEGSGSPNARICIRRAVASDESCGAGSAGWDPAYDATVQLDGISCNETGKGEYVSIDGQYAYSGIQIADQSTGESYAINLNQSQPNHMRLSGLDVSGIATLTTDFDGEGRCLSAISSGVTQGLYIGYSQFHGKPTLILTSGQHDLVFEHNRLFDNVVGNPEAWHPNVWVSLENEVNVAWRYNDVSNWMVEGIMMCPNGAGCTPNGDWYIYGNVWHDAQPGSAARVLEGQYVTHGAMYLYSNTFANLGTVTGSQGNGGTFSSGMATNNLLWNTSASFSAWNIGETTNLEATSDPFVDSAGGDYRLIAGAAPIDSGTAIAPAGGYGFGEDMDGKQRGADGTWDVGAYEH